MTQYSEIFTRSLHAMGDFPSSLLKEFSHTAEKREVKLPNPLVWLEKYLAEKDSNTDPLWDQFGLFIRNWDRLGGPAWGGETSPVSEERRKLIYARLDISSSLIALFDKKIPRFLQSQIPIVIAEHHTHWYDEARRSNRFYWNAYREYLRIQRGWIGDSLNVLNDATDTVVERLSDPASNAPYPSKGLVVGYVQSGKTAHFTGVLAKAADAGYRLIIVLAGTLNILRQQTQRRLDKELLGVELVGADYLNDKDWSSFTTHGGRPSDLGYFDWERLTGSREDYKALQQGISAIEFLRIDKTKPFFDLVNLRTAPVRLVVIKKNPSVIAKLTADLTDIRSRTRLAEVPALIIDDESDQASINTIKPSKTEKQLRTSTNRAITDLLRLLPRGQYVGYTATPFANVLVNADEAESLFPRDFIISLPRPFGYMGVTDFYDWEGAAPGFLSNKRAFVREIEGKDEEPKNLQRALDSFVLAGAIKLYRQHKDAAMFRYEHHTMLIHISVLTASQAEQAEKVANMFSKSGYLVGQGLSRLQRLYEEEFMAVSKAHEPALPFPSKFSTLERFIGQCVSKLTDDKLVRIVNGNNKDDTPNFDTGAVWSILVGGTKLSRGYTVEGLTTSYFRRVSTQTDTLMQMGRWFGFRPGYKDLVRLFISKNEPIGTSGEKTLNLYDAFGAICKDEEEFRSEIQKYVTQDMRPIDIPPLVPSHMDALKPTAQNKMYNAAITSKNLGGASAEPTIAPTLKDDALHNGKLAVELLKTTALKQQMLGGSDATGKMSLFSSYVGYTSPEAMLTFLSSYSFEKDVDALRLEIAYLKGVHGNPSIDRWLVIAPQLATKGGNLTWPNKPTAGIPAFSVKERNRVISGRFGAYSEPAHRTVAKYLAGHETNHLVDGVVKALRADHVAVMLFYPVRPEKSENFVTVGFSLYLPPNELKGKKIAYHTIRRGKNGAPDPVVIDRPKLKS